MTTIKNIKKNMMFKYHVLFVYIAQKYKDQSAFTSVIDRLVEW